MVREGEATIWGGWERFESFGGWKGLRGGAADFLRLGMVICRGIWYNMWR